MNGGQRIIALEALAPQGERGEFVLTEEADAAPDTVAAESWNTDWDADAESSAGSAWRDWLVPGAAVLAIAAWSGTFFWSKRAELVLSPSLEVWLGWLSAWSGPVLVVCVAWLLAMRSSRREARRFGDAARLLGAESEALSKRLTSVNAELSMAREFIAAQSRDLEALGRLAVERLSQNAESLQGLIQANGAQVDAIGKVSSAALDNMEKLRGQLPVIANAARDLTSNIGNAGRTAHVHLQEMISGFKRLNEFGQASERQVETLRQSITQALADMVAQTGELEEFSERRMGAIVERGEALRRDLEAYETRAIDTLRERSEAIAATVAATGAGLAEQERESLAALQRRIDALIENAGQVAARLAESESDAIEQFGGRIGQIDEAIAARQERQQAHVAAIGSHGETVAEQMAAIEARLADMATESERAQARLAENAEAFVARLAEGRAAIDGVDRDISGMTDASVRLLELIQAGSQHSRERIPAALTEAEDRLEAVERRIAAMREAAQDVAGMGEKLDGHIAASHAQLAAAFADIEGLQGRLGASTASQGASLAAIRETLDGLAGQSEGLTTQIESELAEVIERIVAERGGLIVARVEQATQRASELSRETAINLRDQLARIDELAGNLERRVAHARERAEERIENDFARRVALITESLNSNAIDIARALDTEVGETAWAAYLKGERGIFTRRAVSLIDTGEAKSIVQVYENDDDFREHVNRYIHDFEAMLRQVLSTRDGHALGVTLLSSDMGKLYVALAQAIERLRR